MPALAAEQPSTSQPTTAISLWVYPIGEFSDPATVESFIAAFNQKHPDITVTVEYLDYATGDDQISAALSAGTAPDVVMEGPERIVTDWGAKGVMADISDLWTDEATEDISVDGDLVKNACKAADGTYYEYPLCETAHCMAINYELFEQAGALQYLDLENRTWTTEGFMKACRAIADSGLVDTPGVVYCGGQGGDQGTRALVSNLYGAKFTNEAHTAYTIDCPKGVRALATLKSMTDEGFLSCDADIQASDELALFTSESTAMTFAWNSSNERQYASNVAFTPYAMTFPTDQASPSLCSGIYGFGVFDNGDNARIEASKTLISFLCDDAQQGVKSVCATHFFPVRASFGDIYLGTADETWMKDYHSLLQYADDYYNITPGWAAQRTVWWNMLQQVFSGTDPQVAADWYTEIANGAIDKTVQNPVQSISTYSDKHVLFISSYSLNDPTVESQIAGIKKGLGNDVSLHYEFMDSMSVSDEDYVASFYRYISDKYTRISGLGAIIVGDDNALQMVIRYQKGFFRDIPVIYESVNSKTLTELADSLGMMGIPARSTIEDNLDLACQIYPDATKILAISDGSAVGSARSVNLKAIASKYAPMSVEILNTSTLSPDEITARLDAVGDDTILLYLSFSEDGNGKVYPYGEALGLITDHAQAPVFTLAWLGEGSLGGIAADAEEIGRQAGSITDGFLNDRIAVDRQIVMEETVSEIPTTSAFDMDVMNRFGLKKDSFPKDAVFYNDIDDRTKLVVAIVVLAAGIALLGALLIKFVRENRRRKHNESKLQKVSDVLRAEAELDVLTGLGNRRLFDRELSRSVEANRPFALYIIDLDDFKHINDGYGHLVGDMVLRETGSRLLGLKSRSFVPYRYGGDEFAITDFANQQDDAQSVEEKIAELFRDRFPADRDDIAVHASIGSAVFPIDAQTAEGLIRCADQALYAAKTSGKRSSRRFSECEACADLPGGAGEAAEGQ